MIAPTIFIDHDTGVSILVEETFRKLLDFEVVENIHRITVEYNLHRDTIDFLIERCREGIVARMEVPRELFMRYDPVRALRADETQLAKLILFLA